ncbi:MAG TPA: c-type cytochrome [Chitinophagaceae bacterium]|nr:c-type cytochrome [Chitinophagaceae bacterium]MCB9054893.1 c-type cytochrome [Chitinophagales bacterium]HPG12194.1 c-type cytochrome [Chitinophagaceae bacterium]HRX92618.1 c-type cytochrome [Chitinophagaceae bacterium]
MIPCKPTGSKLKIIFLSFFVFSVFQVFAQGDVAAGKAIFNSKCASCHQVLKDGTGPALAGVESRHNWSDHNELLKWVNNPAAYMANDSYTQGLKTKFGSMMTGFADVTLTDIGNVVAYINDAATPKTPTGGSGGGEPQKTTNNALIFGIISLILGIIALILMQVNSNLKKMSDDAEGIVRPEPVPFYRNKIYIALLAIIFFIVGGYLVAKGAIGLGRQKDYQPEQPIFYSHKVHAGINQISCLYCHGGAWDSKHAAIPSVNVCMNCHKAINEYTKGPKLYRENGDEVDGTAEIAKLYKAAGFDPNNPNAWDPSKAQPIEWTKIHNLPDHVYFNHSQHIRAGKVQCQSCHGEITAMDEVKQVADLSMGWCINCHRQTKVDFNYTDSTGNKFYSIYERFHNDIKAGKMDSVTVEHIGGLECQKCHY